MLLADKSPNTGKPTNNGIWYKMGMTSLLSKRLIHRSKYLKNIFLELAQTELYFFSICCLSPSLECRLYQAETPVLLVAASLVLMAVLDTQ